MPDEALLARIDRLESLDEIRQLAAKYSLAWICAIWMPWSIYSPKMSVWEKTK